MTKQEYAEALLSTMWLNLPKSKLAYMVEKTYLTGYAMLFKCSPFKKLYTKLMWPLNRLCTKIADLIPVELLKDEQIMDLSVGLRLVGIIHPSRMKWRIVDEIPLEDVSVETFHEYFATQIEATRNLNKDDAVAMIEGLHKEYRAHRKLG